MATIVNIHEAKTHLSKLIQRAEAGEEIVLARAGKAAVRLSPVGSSPEERPQRYGMLSHLGLKVPSDIKTPFADSIGELAEGDVDKFRDLKTVSRKLKRK